MWRKLSKRSGLGQHNEKCLDLSPLVNLYFIRNFVFVPKTVETSYNFNHEHQVLFRINLSMQAVVIDWIRCLKQKQNTFQCAALSKAQI